MNLSRFLSKNQASDWLTYLVDQLEAWYLAGKQLELMSWLQSSEKTDFNERWLKTRPGFSIYFFICEFIILFYADTLSLVDHCNFAEQPRLVHG